MFFGAILATLVLLLFLRSIPATLAIAATIPVCLIGTFVLLAAFGRTVNVISLAGLAFAAGMVVDNAVVVMENIFRHRSDYGSDRRRAAREAAGEVWAPILASTLTTLAVFVPDLVHSRGSRTALSRHRALHIILRRSLDDRGDHDRPDDREPAAEARATDDRRRG